MEIKFDVISFNDRPIAVFNSEPQPRARLLSTFLEAVRPDPNAILAEIKKAENEDKAPAGFTYNDIDVDIYPDRVILEELYPASGNDEDTESAEFNLNEIKFLVDKWQVELEKWYSEN